MGNLKFEEQEFSS